MTSSYDIPTIRSTNWSGFIPVVLSLAPTSLSSATMPRPLHKMVPRMTYLHIGLSEEVRKMYKFAPALLLKGKGGGGTIRSKMEPPDSPDDRGSKEGNEGEKGNKEDNESSKKKNGDNSTENNDNNSEDENNDGDEDSEDENSFPICWFEDEETGIALRWHLFVGVLFDLLVRRRRRHNQRQSYDNNGKGENEHEAMEEQQKRKQEDGEITSQPLDLPWKIRVHFTSYPTSQILQFDEQDSTSSSSSTVLTTVQRFFHNSLKQSLSLQHGSPKIALNMTKANHETFWESLVRSNYDLYRQVNTGLQVTAATIVQSEKSEPTSEEDVNEEKDEENKKNKCDVDDDEETTSNNVVKVARPWDNLTYIPVRLLVDSNPPIQRPFCVYKDDDDDGLIGAKANDNQNFTSLGDLLLEWVPNLFQREDAKGNDNDQKQNDTSTISPIENVSWSIQGIQPPLSCPAVDLWQCLSYPDHFLYITIDTNTL